MTSHPEATPAPTTATAATAAAPAAEPGTGRTSRHATAIVGVLALTAGGLLTRRAVAAK